MPSTFHNYIGKRYPSCWSFVRAWYANELGITLPATVLRCDMQQVDEPMDHDLVMVRNFSHCGVWYRKGILHQSATQGVIFDTRLHDPHEHFRISSTHQ